MASLPDINSSLSNNFDAQQMSTRNRSTANPISLAVDSEDAYVKLLFIILKAAS